jgi:hypothetical protein
VFYDRDPDGLRKTLDNLLSGLPRGPEYAGCISPHAGYAYSGRTAARALSSLSPSKRFIILGPNHTGTGSEFSLFPGGSWGTPLGSVRVDRGIASDLRESGLAQDDELAHVREHSIEVQLPFLQHLFGQGISFVPVAIMGPGYTRGFLDKCIALGKALAPIARKHDARVIASSDFSHYISWESARQKDGRALDMIRDLDPEGFFRVLHENRASVCGYAPIAVLMACALESKWKSVDVLEYTSSGDVTGDMNEVVAYAAVGFRK